MSTALTTEQAGVTVSGLAVRRGGRLLFSAVAFALTPGEVMLLTGPNGAGKSSLLLTLCGAVRPEAGSVALRGAGPDARPETALHYVGHAAAWDRIDQDGDASAHDVALRFRKGDRTLAVATIFRGRESLEAERAMEQGRST